MKVSPLLKARPKRQVTSGVMSGVGGVALTALPITLKGGEVFTSYRSTLLDSFACSLIHAMSTLKLSNYVQRLTRKMRKPAVKFEYMA
jgi:hypothetical protein